MRRCWTRPGRLWPRMVRLLPAPRRPRPRQPPFLAPLGVIPRPALPRAQLEPGAPDPPVDRPGAAVELVGNRKVRRFLHIRLPREHPQPVAVVDRRRRL